MSPPDSTFKACSMMQRRAARKFKRVGRRPSVPLRKIAGREGHNEKWTPRIPAMNIHHVYPYEVKKLQYLVVAINAIPFGI